MNAHDIMTTDVVSVAPDMPVREVAKLLLARGISAVPVVDADGTPLGIVSEGDLVGRDEAQREARLDWWLQLLAEGETLHPDFLATLRTPAKRARDVMAAPVVTVSPDTPVREVAALLATHRIKRVPVVHDGRIVGIVSRADLLKALVSEAESAPAHHARSVFGGLLAELDGRFLHLGHADDEAAHPAGSARADETGLLATQLQSLVADYKRHERDERDALHQADVERRRALVARLVDAHVTDEDWRALMHRARKAAARGEKQLMLLSFPCDLCSDGGRAINVTEPDWPQTLRGEAAELYLRWERELKPHGFHLSASVLNFPGGKPGDVGLFLGWGD